MNVASLIVKLKRNGIGIDIIDQELRISTGTAGIAPALLDELRSAKADLIRYLSASRSSALPTIPIARKQLHYPLSHSQRRIWIESQVNGNSPVYNLPCVYTIESALDINSLESALRKLMERHEILRTVFVNVDGEPVQKILPPEQAVLEILYQDLRGVSDRMTIAQGSIREKMTHVFDLARGPLLSVDVWQIDEQKFYVLLNIHHIIADRWSLDILIRELSALHNAIRDGNEDPLGQLRIQYKDYAVWHHDMLLQPEHSKHSAYWMAMFKAQIPVLDLPADKPWPKVRTVNGYAREVLLNPDTGTRLRSLARQNKVSLFSVFFSVVNVLLHKYCQQDDIVVGVLTTGREHSDLVNQIGFYVNTLPVRVAIDSRLSFRDFLLGQYKRILEVYEHQMYPFDRLLEDLDISFDRSRNPLFDVLISFQRIEESADGRQRISDEEKGALLENAVLNSKFPLSFELTEYNDHLKIGIGFNSDVFEEASIDRMLRNFATLCVSVTSDSEMAIGNLDYLDATEKEVILEDFNGTKAPFPDSATLHSLFEEQVARTPYATAMIGERGCITYSCLNENANRLANLLKNVYGVRPDSLVAVMVGRSFEMIQVLLGILKSGAGYVPIEPEFPERRIAYVLEDAGVEILIAENQAAVDKWSSAKRKVIALTTLGMELTKYGPENPTSGNSASDMACLLYTSGSTGNPKGVMVEHRGLVNRICWLWKQYAFTSEDVYFQRTTYVFDVSIGEIFMTLCFGAKLLIVNNKTVVDPPRVAKAVERYRATTINFSPTALNQFHSMLVDGDYLLMHSLRHILASGEELKPEVVRRHYSRMDTPLYNLYGPTEASIEVSFFETSNTDRVVPIGKPIPNVKLLILDKNDTLSPIGVPGEICIGGVALARGYYQREAQTSERFFESRYGHGDARRLYRTGDIGRWLPDGNIEFMGRRDNQVSIGGYRIELGEIESALCEHPRVKEAIVVTHRDVEGDTGLVAYIETERVIENAFELKAAAHTLTAEERGLMVTSNVLRAEIDLNISFMELFEEQVRLTPDLPAVVFGEKVITYQEANTLANQYAHVLRSKYDVKSGDFVGLLVGRTEEMVIATLAIIKTGAVYIPVDSDYPDERIRFIIHDSDMKLLITDQVSFTSSYVGVVLLSSLAIVAAEQVFDNPVTDIAPDDLVYIIYTSGSTGSPKGVMVSHGNLTSIAQSWRDQYGLGDFRVSLLQVAGMAFDVFTGDLCRALLNGGKLVICPTALRSDPAAIGKLITMHGINVIEGTPMFITTLMDYLYQFEVDISFLKLLIIGSDVVSLDAFTQLTERFGHAIRIVNSYGTTEATIDSCFYDPYQGISRMCKNTPIGRPYANTLLYILDHKLNPVPIGQEGELCIGGMGVARGYWKREALTKERFVQDPFNGGRMFKTGDVVRWLPDGNIEFLGRLDGQVKMRGFRIELGEIENVLLKHGGMRQVVVRPVDGGDDERSLCAYYVSASILDERDLKMFLAERLPEYMIPFFWIRLEALPLTLHGKVDVRALPQVVDPGMTSLRSALKRFLSDRILSYMVPTTYIFIDKFPVTASGKIDRNALPKPELFETTVQDDCIFPENELQQKLHEIWCAVLNRKRIGIHDNFFEIGGHSLKVMKMLTRISRDLAMTLDFRTIFDYPTLKGLGDHLAFKQYLLEESAENGSDVEVYI